MNGWGINPFNLPYRGNGPFDLPNESDIFRALNNLGYLIEPGGSEAEPFLYQIKEKKIRGGTEDITEECGRGMTLLFYAVEIWKKAAESINEDRIEETQELWRENQELSREVARLHQRANNLAQQNIVQTAQNATLLQNIQTLTNERNQYLDHLQRYERRAR